MILAFDTYYDDHKAKTVCIQFEGWSATHAENSYTEILTHIEPYIPGEFFRRELPCILSLLRQADLRQAEAIIIDGYVYVNDDLQPGLGGHLYHALSGKVPVIGVAKSNFRGLDKMKLPLYRGESNNPLYITAIGMDPSQARDLIGQMSGPHRIPALLKSLDRLTRSGFH